MFDLRKKDYECIAEGNYYGVTWNEKYIFASRNLTDKPVSVVDVFTKEFKKIETLVMSELGGVHQIYFRDNLLYIANTNYDCIDIWNIKNKSVQTIDWIKSNKDTRHINSIWANDNYFYFIESGASPGKTDKKEHFTPIVRVFNSDYSLAKSIEFPLTFQLHNIYIENDMIFSCGRYGMITKKFQSQKYYNIRQKNGFLRGLAKTKNHFFIGESQELPRKERLKSLASIIMMDNNFNIINTFDLIDTGQIHDIRIMSGDLAHNGIDL